MKWDTLAFSQWTRLEEICNLLRPFAAHTDQIQKDVLAMPYIIPIVLDLQCYLDEPSHNALMASTLKRSLNERFSKYLDPDDTDFDPLPVVACLLTPEVAGVLFTHGTEPLIAAAKKYIPVLITNYLIVIQLRWLLLSPH